MIFAIDFGLKRIGIARLLQGIVVPLAPIIRKNRKEASKELKNTLIKYCNLEEITLIVGIPLKEDFERDRASEILKDFTKVFQKDCLGDFRRDFLDFKDSRDSRMKENDEPKVVMQERVRHFLSLMDFCGKVIYVDESYSSIEASDRLSDRRYNKRKNARKNGTLDSISACIILERYLEKIKAQQDSIMATENIAEGEIISKNEMQDLKITSRNQYGKNQHEKLNEFEKSSSIESKDSISLKTDKICKKDLDSNILREKTSTSISHNLTKTKTLDSIKNSSENADFANKECNKKARANNQKTPHTPVLLEHVVDVFDKIFTTKTHLQNLEKTPKVIIDCTLGFGGMSGALLRRYDDLQIIGIDRDLQALDFNREAMAEFGTRFQMRHGDFATMLPKVIEEVGSRQLCGILADIGVSSYQLDSHERGFSFHSRELDMRMDRTQTLRADTIINTYGKYELEQIFKNYGEIKEYKKLTQLILQERKNKTITGQNLQNIALQIRTKGKIHPATLIYQALRIAVNDELAQLQSLLDTCSSLKKVMLCIISFHSLEDRMVKDSMKKWAKSCICDEASFKCTCGNNHAKGFLLYKKPLVANSKELASNKRARSAKLRAFYFM